MFGQEKIFSGHTYKKQNQAKQEWKISFEVYFIDFPLYFSASVNLALFTQILKHQIYIQPKQQQQ